LLNFQPRIVPMAKLNSKNLDIEKTSRLLKAVCDPDRLRLVLQLKEGKKKVRTPADALGAEILNISHPLGVLRGHKVFRAEKVGRFVFYSLNPDVISMEGGALQVQMGGCKLIIG